MATDLLPCYRHPDRPGGVRCQRCDRPICPACMTTASVGFHCPECARSGRQKVYTGRAAFGGSKTLRLTPALIAINVVVFVLSLSGGGSASEIGGSVLRDYGLYGPSIRYDHEWYRIITAGFLHSGLLHIGFNMYALWIIGNMLEPALGRLRFGIARPGPERRPTPVVREGRRAPDSSSRRDLDRVAAAVLVVDPRRGSGSRGQPQYDSSRLDRQNRRPGTRATGPPTATRTARRRPRTGCGCARPGPPGSRLRSCSEVWS